MFTKGAFIRNASEAKQNNKYEKRTRGNMY
jgi:hypothetical protein